MKIRRIYKDVYVYISSDGRIYKEVGYRELAEPEINSIVGFFFTNGESELWNADNPQVAVFSNMYLRRIDTVIIEPMKVPLIYAVDSIKIGDRSKIIGQVGCGGYINILADGYLGGTDTIYVVKRVTAQDRAIISGNLYLGDSLKLINGAKHIGGLVEGALVKIDTLPLYVIKYGTVSRTISGVEELKSGDYKDILVKSRANLILTGGVYNINKLITEPDAVITLKNSVELNIESELNLNDRYEIKVEKSGLTFKVYTNGNVTISEQRGDYSNHIKDIQAPKGVLKMKSRSKYKGYINVNRLVVEPDVEIKN